MEELPWLIHSHDTTWHDGGIATLLPDGRIVSLASERTGPREKHTYDSSLAYDLLIQRLLGEGFDYRVAEDRFSNPTNARSRHHNHHLNHAASTFFGSGFKEASVLVVDGQGPKNGVLETTTVWVGRDSKIDFVESLHSSPYPFASSSLGHFYTAIGALAGMPGLHDEGKTMGLAPYGRSSKIGDYISRFIEFENDGNYKIDDRFTLAVLGNTFGPKIFNWPKLQSDIQEIWSDLQNLRTLRGVARPNQDDANIAFAGQNILEKAMLGLARRTRANVSSSRLCLAGGVALNCVANEKIRGLGIFDDVFVFPAAGDDGQALGKLYLDIHLRNLGVNTAISTAFLGPTYSENELYSAINSQIDWVVISDSPEQTQINAAQRLAAGKILGCCRGRSELGPRALGHRSILADPRRPEMRDRINFLVKLREWYRPVAPIVLEREAHRYFKMDRPSPYMTFAVEVHDKTRLLAPSIVHVDGTARVQTVNEQQDEFMVKLLEAFSDIAAIPILINTSFNEAGRPIVETYRDALLTAKSMALDGLILGHLMLELAE